MRVKKKGELEAPSSSEPSRLAIERKRQDVNRLTRRVQKDLRYIVNNNEAMSCSRLRSWIGS